MDFVVLTHAAPAVSEGQCRDIAVSSSHTDCRQRATSQRSHRARANEHVASSKTRGGGDSERRNSENIRRISRARPGRRPVRLETRLRAGPTSRGLESHRPRRAWARDLKISPAGPGAGWARRGRPGPARPHLRELEISRNVTQNVTHQLIFVRNGPC